MKSVNLFFYLFVFSLICVSCGDECDDVVVPDGFICLDGVLMQDPNLVTDECIAVSENISSNTTWTSDNCYLLTDKIFVTDGATLTIEAGTIIKGGAGTAANATALIIARGGKIDAQGTASSPIVMTSTIDNIAIGQSVGDNLTENQFGLWGGLIVLGKAPCSLGGDTPEEQIEGIPPGLSEGLYGGNDAADNSGIIRYVSVRHGGAILGGDNEINGITLGGVGSGTVIENVEVVGNQDDGIEFFGGTVSVKNALVWAQGDDAYDIDQAWSGTLDNFVYIAGEASDHGLEVDGPEGSAVAGFVLTNGTLKGATAEMADFRDASRGDVNNCYFIGFEAGSDVELDDDGTSVNYFAGDLLIRNNDFNLADGVEFSDVFADKSVNGDDAAFKTQMTAENAATDSPSRGADISVFSWTMAHHKGVLNF